MASKAFAVIVGVGPGTGAAIATRFAGAYPVACLARNPDSYEPVVQDIKKNGGQAIGISADISQEDSVKAAFEKIKQEYAGMGCAAAIFNASARPKKQPLLDMTVDDFTSMWNIGW